MTPEQECTQSHEAFHMKVNKISKNQKQTKKKRKAFLIMVMSYWAGQMLVFIRTGLPGSLPAQYLFSHVCAWQAFSEHALSVFSSPGRERSSSPVLSIDFLHMLMLLAHPVPILLLQCHPFYCFQNHLWAPLVAPAAWAFCDWLPSYPVVSIRLSLL